MGAPGLGHPNRTFTVVLNLFLFGVETAAGAADIEPGLTKRFKKIIRDVLFYQIIHASPGI